ncbi:MAG: hypothetical protein HYU33_03595 [Candidatus Omnitrophica bacterium]|nr:hypothetical protein [Candidatus Omnitrophota bacterium]MBI3010458.1 hypothetical protein [Candidatus Omnitrophota bacterium]
MSALTSVLDELNAVASAIECSEPEARFVKRLDAVLAGCGEALSDSRPGPLHDFLTQVSAAVSTWQKVWPRLGKDAQFRQAVSREAVGWAKRLSAVS